MLPEKRKQHHIWLEQKRTDLYVVVRCEWRLDCQVALRRAEKPTYPQLVSFSYFQSSISKGKNCFSATAYVWLRGQIAALRGQIAGEKGQIAGEKGQIAGLGTC
jgi:hypothetical protein